MFRPTQPLPAENQGATNAAPVAPQQPQVSQPALRILAPIGHCPVSLAEGLLQKAREMNPTSLPSKVVIDTYASDAEALLKFNSTPPYSWAALPDHLVGEKIKAEALQPLPTSLFSGIDPIYLHHAFDSLNRFSFPYACTFYAFVVHKDAFPKASDIPNSWKKLFSDEIFSQCSLPDDPNLLYTLNLLASGQIGKPQKQIIHRPRAIPAGGTEDQPIRVGTIESLYPLTKSNPSWMLVLPEEGLPIRLYHWTLPKGAQPQADETLTAAFFKIWLTQEGSEHLAKRAYLTPVSKKARKHLSPTMEKETSILLPDSMMNKTVFIQKPPTP